MGIIDLDDVAETCKYSEKGKQKTSLPPLRATNSSLNERGLTAGNILTAKRIVSGVFEGDTHKVILQKISLD